MKSFLCHRWWSLTVTRAIRATGKRGTEAALAGTLAALSAAGCSSTGASSGLDSSRSSAAVDRLHLLVTAIALEMDGKPGPDGFGARIYASSRNLAAATPIRSGRLEVLMYDGSVKPEEMAAVKPLQTWVFEPKQLRALTQQTSIGTGYRFALAWGENKPSQNRVTIVAKHFSENGAEVVSAPGIVPLISN